ncbi:MAG: hypothetical protein ACRDRG_05415 [Pseudonocardiaceae bacterium]
MSRAYVSLIQSDYGKDQHGNFEAVIVHGRQLLHWFRDNSQNNFGHWVRGQRITGEHDNVAGPGCLIQSTFGAGRHRNFEVVVPLHLDDGSMELRHFFHDNSDIRLPWTKTLLWKMGSASSCTYRTPITHRKVSVPIVARI